MEGLMKLIQKGIICTAAVLLGSLSAVAQPTGQHSMVSRGLAGAPKKADPNCVVPPKDPVIWDKSVTAGFNYTDGNSKTSALNLNGKLMRDYLDNAWRFEADYNYGNAAPDPDARRELNKHNFRANGDYKHTLDSIWFAGANTSYAYDQIADLDYRVILSPNLGAYLVKNDTTKFSLEAGPSYVFERLGTENDNFAAARIADRLEWQLSETSLLYQSAEYLISLEDSGDYIVNAEIGVEAALTSMINLVVSVRDYYINQPAEGRKSNDVYTITGLKVNL
jgi:putative salt-induced outer membrane protein YdiY